MTREQLINGMAAAIARMEGYMDATGQPRSGTIAFNNNNPGNLRAWGNLPTANGYAVFPTAAEGWAALKRQIGLNIDRGLTLYEFFGGKPGVYPGYAPSSDGNKPATYAQFVATQIGIPPDAVISEVVATAGTNTGTGNNPTPGTGPSAGNPYTPPPVPSGPLPVDKWAWKQYVDSILSPGATPEGYYRLQTLTDALPWAIAVLGAIGLWVAAR